MDYTCFEITRDGGVAHLVLNQPDRRNAMVAAFWSELPAAMTALDESGDVRCLVISAEGKHFTAGMDLAVLAGMDIFPEGEPGRTRAHLLQLVRKLQDTFTALTRTRFPVIAAVNGACVGGGVDFVTAADIRLAAEDAFFCIQEVNIGMVADVGTYPRIQHLLPDGLVRELAYTGRRWGAAEAREQGFVNRVFPDRESMVAAALEMATTIAAKSPLTIWGTKEVLNHHREAQIAGTLKYLSAWQSGMLQAGELGSSIQAMQADETPEYDDLLPVPKKL